ncbi:L-ribulose-5-phosphate 3-epimerase [Granulicatella balaenopterae]|uniref:L-ribulose-5-phosphate 3-epimerase n=1 Tax=Granulicatella balaenopterae TaxID=137733 RepID=A0A1H9MVR7_9LACT|nr:L-ribulose-5-phosphate 3-epimerase [Granulicatella balaenopterae]SER27617.1 L-ribulose-5-phosphate 3-epimerase [Granulicatella balaenopterae]
MYELGLYEKSMPNTLSIKEKLTIVKETGFDFLELSIDESDEKQARLDWTKEERFQLVQDMYQVGVPIRSICLSGHRKYPFGSHDESIRQQSLVIMKKAIDLADDLGVRIIQLAGYDVYYEEGDADTLEWFIDNLRIAVDMASQKGIILGFETMETPFMNTVEKSMRFVELMDSPYLQVYPDSGNLKNASLEPGAKNVYEDILIGKGHIVAAHLKETIPGHYREIPFGTGHIDFKKMIASFLAIGVKRFTGEFWYVGQEDWKKDIIEANQFLRSYFPNK